MEHNKLQSHSGAPSGAEKRDYLFYFLYDWGCLLARESSFSGRNLEEKVSNFIFDAICSNIQQILDKPDDLLKFIQNTLQVEGRTLFLKGNPSDREERKPKRRELTKSSTPQEVNPADRVSVDSEHMIEDDWDLEMYYNVAKNALESGLFDLAFKISREGARKARSRGNPKWQEKLHRIYTDVRVLRHTTEAETLLKCARKEEQVFKYGRAQNYAKKAFDHLTKRILLEKDSKGTYRQLEKLKKRINRVDKLRRKQEE